MSNTYVINFPVCYDRPIIKAIIFDYGGILTSGGGESAERSATNLQLPIDKDKDVVTELGI